MEQPRVYTGCGTAHWNEEKNMSGAGAENETGGLVTVSRGGNMKHSEKNYWLFAWFYNRGFWSFSFSILMIAIMICKLSKDIPLINLSILD